MTSYVGRRLLQLIPVLVGMSLIVFAIIHLIPGDPAQVILGAQATPEAVHALRVSLGLNDPPYLQYAHYMKQVLSGDLGTSIVTGQPITQEIWPHLAATIELSLSALIFALLVGVNAGVIAAWKRSSSADYLAMIIALGGVSIPVFWLGLMAQWVFSQKVGLLPSIGQSSSRGSFEAITHFYVLDAVLTGNWSGLWDVIKHLILPSVVLGAGPMAIFARMTRSSMVDVLNSDYLRSARAKGLSELTVLYKHALKNALAPVATVLGMELGALFGGAVLVEAIFGWPGIGDYIYGGITSRDYPVVQSGVLILAFIFVMVNLVVDISYAYSDPRIHY